MLVRCFGFLQADNISLRLICESAEQWHAQTYRVYVPCNEFHEKNIGRFSSFDYACFGFVLELLKDLSQMGGRSMSGWRAPVLACIAALLSRVTAFLEAAICCPL